MRLNVKDVLKDIDGTAMGDMVHVPGEGTKTLVNPDGSKVPLTIMKVAIRALTAPDEKISGEEKLKRSILAEKIYNANPFVDLTSEEITLIKDRVDKTFTLPYLYKAAVDVLDPKTPKEKLKSVDDPDTEEDNTPETAPAKKSRRKRS